MLSMYTVMLLSAMRSWKIVFIIIWNIARELVSLKNMMVGSNSPLFVVNTTFHWLPSLIQMLLYPHLMLNFMNKVHPCSWSIS